MRVVCVLEANDLFEMCEGGYSIGISACETHSSAVLSLSWRAHCNNYKVFELSAKTQINIILACLPVSDFHMVSV